MINSGSVTLKSLIFSGERVEVTWGFYMYNINLDKMSNNIWTKEQNISYGVNKPKII